MFEIGDMVKVIGDNQSEEIGEHNIDDGTVGEVVNVFVDEEFEYGVCITNLKSHLMKNQTIFILKQER